MLIAIYEVYSNGAISHPTVYAYGNGSNPNLPDYAIAGNKYQLNFDTATGVHDYRIEAYTAVLSSSSCSACSGSVYPGEKLQQVRVLVRRRR